MGGEIIVFLFSAGQSAPTTNFQHTDQFKIIAAGNARAGLQKLRSQSVKKR